MLVVDSRTLDEAVVTFTGVPAASWHRDYQLWLMTATGAAGSVSLMSTAPAASILLTGLDGESQLGMTVEPDGGSSQPTTTPAMIAALG